MIVTEIVETADDKHARGEGLGLLRQMASAAREAAQPLAERGVQPLDIGSVDHAAALGGIDELCNHLTCTLHDAAVDSQLASRTLFDNLYNGDVRPGQQLRSAVWTAAWQGGPEGFSKRVHIARQTVHRQQERSRESNRTDLLGQRANELFVTFGTDDATQPQPRRDHHGHGHPERAALRLDFDLIRLYLLQVQLTFPDHMRMDGMAPFSRTTPPSLHCTLVQSESRHDRLARATITTLSGATRVGQQGDYQHHDLRVSAQAIEKRAFGRREGRVAHLALVAFFLLTMDADIPFASLTSCRTIDIRAECFRRVHWPPPALHKPQLQEFASEPAFVQALALNTSDHG